MLTIQTLTTEKFQDLLSLEESIWESQGEKTLCAHFLRLCTEFYPDICFIAYQDQLPVGYILNFKRDQQIWCATMAVHPQFRGTRVLLKLLDATTKRCRDLKIEEVYFTVTPDNSLAIKIHEKLGAKFLRIHEDYYFPGDRRLLGVIRQEYAKPTNVSPDAQYVA